MEFKLSEDQVAMVDAVRRMVQREIDPVLEEHDRTHSMPKETFLDMFGKLADMGLTAPRIPESAGGSALKMLDYGLMFEQIPPSVSMSMVSQDGCITRLHAEANEEQKARFLPDLIAGRKLGCTGSTEPGTGSDPRGIQARITRDGDSLILNGTKMWITNVSVCDTIIVTCLDRTEDPEGEDVVKVVVEREHSPFEAREIDAIGLNQGLLGEVTFQDCVVPIENMIRSKGSGTQILKQSWEVNRPLLGLQACYLAQKSLDTALEYVGQRQQFGKLIAGHQLVQKNLSDIDTAIEASRMLCYRALDLIDQGQVATGAAAMAKRFAQNACLQAISEAMNLLGAIGLSREARLEEYYRDCRMIAIPDGTNEILALIHGRELTGVQAFRTLN